jgi:Flp pilus assembly protein TadD
MNINEKKTIAYEFIQKGLILRALDTYKDILTVTPDDYEVICNIAYLYFNEKDFDEAVKYSSDAIRLKPEESGFYFNRGNAYFNLKRFEEARQNFITAANLKKDDNNWINAGLNLTLTANKRNFLFKIS